MSAIKDGGPAFAAMGIGPAGDVYHEPGMSLRDWFAGQAIPLAVAFHNNPANAAKWCFEYADAMLAEREKGLSE